ncbi:MAG: YegS/Rv2252/BmrU family lipid kinase [Candidatus Lutibacillus vidarii]|nr:YegS/Rv2252/BmrU family lipid kinase [Dermatophilaceae bacterium]
MGQRIGVVVNPTSGRGRGAAMGAAAVARLRASGGEVVDLSGDSHAHSTDNARGAVASGGIDVLAVVGGDGMAHLGVNACAGTPVALAIIAAGTGNDNARSLGLPIRQPEQAADLISSGAVRTIDAGRMRASDGDRWWIGVLGGGFDSVVTERAHRWSWPKGPMRYNLAVARELPVFTAIPYAIEVDGHRVETTAMLVAVGNGPAFGGGMLVLPEAKFDDGLLDVLILHEVSVLEFLKVFPRVFKGTHVTHPKIEILRGEKVRLETTGIMAQADGERFHPMPIDVEVAPGALRVVAPSSRYVT